jgi:hypothetical protein
VPVYFEYALKASISVAVVFLFYTLLLKRLTHYTWNRYFLLFFSVLSFIVPFVNIGLFVEADTLSGVPLIHNIVPVNSYELVPDSSSGEGGFAYWRLVSLIILVVSVILVLRLLVQLLSIEMIKSKATLLKAGAVCIYNLSEPVLPFSFLNNIYVCTAEYNENELPEIIEHERVHVQQKHTVDVLISEIICVFNWYNPFAWLLKKAIRENLEFIADDAVIRKGIDKKSYQYLLLKVTGDLPSPIANNFNFSSLKNRILMMNKSKSSSIHLLKFVLLIPVTMFLLLAFRSGTENQANKAVVKNTATESYILSTLTYAIDDEKVRSLVVKEQAKSFLKTGELLNLTLIHNEKDRLKNLLERNGYYNLKSNAIAFMIDTASINNSFSVEIKINVNPAIALRHRQTNGSQAVPKTIATDQVTAPTQEVVSKDAAGSKLQPAVSGLYTHLDVAKSKQGC